MVEERPDTPEGGTTSTSVGRSFVDEAADVALVLRARRLRRRSRAVFRFTGRALLLVVPLLLLGAVAVPGFIRFGCRSKMSEAKTNLKAIFVAEEAFRAEHDRYAASANEIGFAPFRSLRYRYAIVDVRQVGVDEVDADNPVAGPRFRAYAFANGVDPTHTNDVWRIDETNDLVHVVDGCRE